MKSLLDDKHKKKRQAKLSKQKIILFDIDYTLFDTDLFFDSNPRQYSLYKEVHDVLHKLIDSAQLGIFSEGDLESQRKKLVRTQIERYFLKNHIHIVIKKDEVIKKILNKYNKQEELFLVDDKLTVLYMAKVQKSSIFTIWVKRGIYADSKLPLKGFTPDAIVYTLDEILPFIIE